MKTYHFEPHVKVTGNMPDYSELIIKKEPMLFSADKDFAMKNGGEITKTFIQNFLSDYNDWIIDTRTHMLFKDFYPCIPGWHHDDVPRNTKSGQPNYDNPEYYSDHRMCVIGKSAMPEFIACKTEMPRIEDGKIIYKEWNDIINKKYVPYLYEVKSSEVIDFDWQDFHRGMPANENCWRFFIRASRNTNRQFFNEIRTQVQVYLPVIDAGW